MSDLPSPFQSVNDAGLVVRRDGRLLLQVIPESVDRARGCLGERPRLFEEVSRPRDNGQRRLLALAYRLSEACQQRIVRPHEYKRRDLQMEEVVWLRRWRTLDRRRRTYPMVSCGTQRDNGAQTGARDADCIRLESG